MTMTENGARVRVFKKGHLCKVILYFFSGLIFCLHAFAGDIAVYGDSQHNQEIQRKLVHTIVSFKPSIVFRMGDMVDNGNDPRQWEVFRDINRPLLETTEYFPAPGNHEQDSPLYFENFRFLGNRRWYSVEREGIHFIVLDSNSRLAPGSEQYKWLALDLAEAEKTAKFKIVIFHHPLFDVSKNHESDEKNLKPVLLPLFEKYGVSAVFSGHSHDYQRFEYNGTYFIVTGGGGSNLYSQFRTSPYLQKFIMAYHFCLLVSEDSFLNIKVIDIDSNIIDDFKISFKVQK